MTIRQNVRKSPVALSIGLGVLAGMRSMSAPTRVAYSRGSSSRGLWTVLAGAELLTDKLPFTPDRTTTPQLLVRAASGGLAAYFFVSDAPLSRPSRWMLAGVTALGALSAVVATYATFHARRRLSRVLPASMVAVGEDALNVKLGSYLFA